MSTKCRQWSPVELEVLLRCYYSGEPDNGIPEGTSYREARDMWARNNCIEVIQQDIGKITARYNTTEKGKTLIDMLLSTPMPISSWRDPRESKS